MESGWQQVRAEKLRLEKEFQGLSLLAVEHQQPHLT